jgi:heme-degrading monooxygenase HmoA
MYARIVWGKIQPGKWSEYEAAYRNAISARGPTNGLVMQWLARDDRDPDAGYSISIWESKAALEAYVDSKQHQDMTAPLKPFFVNQYTSTHCDIRYLARNVPQATPGDLDIYHTN